MRPVAIVNGDRHPDGAHRLSEAFHRFEFVPISGTSCDLPRQTREGARHAYDAAVARRWLGFLDRTFHRRFMGR